MFVLTAQSFPQVSLSRCPDLNRRSPCTTLHKHVLCSSSPAHRRECCSPTASAHAREGCAAQVGFSPALEKPSEAPLTATIAYVKASKVPYCKKITRLNPLSIHLSNQKHKTGSICHHELLAHDHDMKMAGISTDENHSPLLWLL